MNIFKLLYSPKGRIKRKAFVWTNLIVFLMIVPVVYIALINSGDNGGIDFIIIILVSVGYIYLIFYPILILTSIKRIHDIECSCYMVFLYLSPSIGLIFFIFLSFAKGKVGDNKYGASLYKNNNIPVVKNTVNSLN